MTLGPSKIRVTKIIPVKVAQVNLSSQICSVAEELQYLYIVITAWIEMFLDFRVAEIMLLSSFQDFKT